MRRRCSVCGCTDSQACIDRFGTPCYWVEPDLCSECSVMSSELIDVSDDADGGDVRIYSEGEANAYIRERRGAHAL
jgi:hypothetical protein